jgi:hypothetical protein
MLRRVLKMLIFDFYSGTGSATQAFKDAGHRVISFELDKSFKADEHVDIGTLNAADLVSRYGMPDFVWASPPCTAFSVASIGKHWHPDKTPKSDLAKASIKLIAHTLELIRNINPHAWLIENPRGMLRKQPIVKELTRHTITYCSYGDTRMKPTDLWGYVPGWTPRQACTNGQPCHVAAPRGSRTGTQGIKGAKSRSMLPIALSQELLGVLG